MRRASLAQRTVFCTVFEPEVALGPRACRVDLAERVAQALVNGVADNDALRPLSIPRRDAARVLRAIREHLTPSAGAA